jgi:hypothetical protein
MQYRKQKGMSFIGFLMIMAMVLFILYLGLRIVPIYLEYYSVVNAMNGIAQERGSARYSPYDIRAKMLNRLYVSYSDDNVGEDDIKIVRRNGVQLRVVYQARKDLIGNLEVVASFDRMVMLSN